MKRLLIVDDEPSICWGLARLGESLGHEVLTASSAEVALEEVRTQPPDVIVLDIRLPGVDGLTAIERFRQRCGDVPIIVITAYGDLHTAVAAVRKGVFDYLIKPFDLERFERVLSRALSPPTSPTSAPASAPQAGFVGNSPQMQEVFKRIALVAAAEAHVTVCGESGTGKELAARAIHRFSHRAAGPFVPVNIASLSPTLAESELFGHVRGAFTGADAPRDGLLVQADQGTLFLDEVADIPLTIQVKLLRALEHGEVTPVGGSQSLPTRFRVVSATHQDLLERIEAGEFRHDLYFRLTAFRIDIPPLRDRTEDILPLAEHFLGLAATRGMPPAALSPAACRELKQRAWYGNVRELRNAIDHAVILARGGVIDPEQLPEPAPAVWLTRDHPAPSTEETLIRQVRRWSQTQLEEPARQGRLHQELLQIVEPPLLQAAMEHYGQYLTAAQALGMHRTTLRKKLAEYAIEQDNSTTPTSQND